MKKDNKWIWVAVLAAAVAAVTTVAIVLLRAHRKVLCGCSDTAYDYDDCVYDEDMCDDCGCAADEPVEGSTPVQPADDQADTSEE